MRIGVDVGGTNTDAVLMEGRRVVASTKRSTTADVTGGIVEALETVLGDAGVDAGAIEAVMIGTTHFTNAVVERRIAPAACVRLGLPATEALPPMVDWPDDLRDVSGCRWYLAHGGNEFDGRELSPLDEAELCAIAADLRAHDIRSIAVSAVFSPVTPDAEERAAAVLQQELPEATMTLSHEIGRIGLLERENAAIVNACLRDLARTTVNGFRMALEHLGLDSPLYLTQNDGTLMTAGFAERFPVLTFSSGPTNSMRGAAFLSGLRDAIVIDVGGTTTDVGVLTRGFPREAALAVSIGGVRTNFRMPDVLSVGLGGGSIVTGDPWRVGPRSVGYRLGSEALIFGGATVTATDIAVAGGLIELGDPARVAHLQADAPAVLDVIAAMVRDAVDAARVSAEPLPVVVVGGGSPLAVAALRNVDVVTPEHSAVANAVGAAIAQVSGEVDHIVSLDGTTREAALSASVAAAIARAVAAGADAETVQVVDIEDVPLAYLPGNATRVRVKVAGDLPGGGGNGR